MKSDFGARVADQGVILVPALLTSREVAEILGKSEKWLERDRWIGNEIPFSKVGRSVRYLAEDIAAYIMAGRVVK